MRLLVVFLAIHFVKSSVNAVPIDGRSLEVMKPDIKEISLKLLPPELPRSHYHNHQAATRPPTASTTRKFHHHTVTATKPPVTGTSTFPPKKPQADIIRYEYENLPDGGYRFLYETSDGQTRNEVGYFRDDEKLGRLLTVRGSYTYTGDDGKLRIVRYTADENGYRQDEGEAPAQSLPANVAATLAG